MPWDYKKTSDGKWEVYNKNTGKSKGTSDTKEKALAHIRALYAHASPEETKKRVIKKMVGF